MTATFDWVGLRHLTSWELKAAIEAAFVPVDRYEERGEVLLAETKALNREFTRAEAAEARNKVLEEALVEAAIPLHAMRLAGTVENFSPEMREGVENAVERINQALGATHD